MGNKRQQFGKESESLAARHLKKNGYKILERNYRNKLGEIDIIARDRDTLVFVEVKAKRSDRFGGPKEAVTHKKQQKISKVALLYLNETNQNNLKARFDVVAILSTRDSTSIEIVKNAFELAYT